MSYFGPPVITAKNLWLRRCQSISVSAHQAVPFAAPQPPARACPRAPQSPKGAFSPDFPGLRTAPGLGKWSEPWVGGAAGGHARTPLTRTHKGHSRVPAGAALWAGGVREPSPSNMPSFWLPDARGVEPRGRPKSHTQMPRCATGLRLRAEHPPGTRPEQEAAITALSF